MSKAFVINDISFKYSEKSDFVIKNLSCEIEKGSFVCLVGTNGSGKSTLVKLLADVLQPQSGTITKSSKYSALVFQNPDNQFVSNIVEEDVAFGPENLCVEPQEIRNIVDESLKSVDMYEERCRAISSLSEGEKQRVAIAGALALSSDCLILDEPTSMLSNEDAKNIIDYILKLNRERGTTVVCVSQNPDLALRADLLLIMNSGKIDKIVTPDDFIKNYDQYSDCGIVLSEEIKLIKLLNEKGFDIKLKNHSPELIVEEICKRC